MKAKSEAGEESRGEGHVRAEHVTNVPHADLRRAGAEEEVSRSVRCQSAVLRPKLNLLNLLRAVGAIEAAPFKCPI